MTSGCTRAPPEFSVPRRRRALNSRFQRDATECVTKRSEFVRKFKKKNQSKRKVKRTKVRLKKSRFVIFFKFVL